MPFSGIEPVVRDSARTRRMFADVPAIDREGAAAGFVLLQPGFAFVTVDIVLLHERGIGDEEPGQDRVVGRKWLEQALILSVVRIDDLDRVLIHHGDEHPGHAEVFPQHALEVVLHRLGVTVEPSWKVALSASLIVQVVASGLPVTSVAIKRFQLGRVCLHSAAELS